MMCLRTNFWHRPRALLTSLLLSLTVMMTSTVAHPAEIKNVKIMMDWLIQSTHAPFFIAQEKGYYKAEGVTVDAIDSGRGATNVATAVAGGSHQFGYVDLPSMIRFNAQNPATPLIAVYMSFDESPSSIISLKQNGIAKPADLDGKKIAGGPGTAVRDTISILLRAAGTPNVQINWVAVSPQLFSPMLKRGEVDGIGAFTNSQIPALLEIGVKAEDMTILKFSDFGADLYGLALVTTKKFADENPETVRGVVRAVNHGIKDAIASPEAALKLMTTRDPLMKAEFEGVRLQIVLGHTNTPFVSKNGLSSVTADRLKRNIDSIVSAYDLTNKPEPAAIYTDKFLPSAAERMPPKSGN